MRALYHPSIYDTAAPVPSYWQESAGPWDDTRCAPLDGDAEAEIAIIGAGYTGLSAAYHLARDHGVAACVLEAGPIGFGASGRNGGFCCLGSAKLSYGRMVARFGQEETGRFIRAQVEAVELVRALGCEQAIVFDAQGEGTITVAHRPSRMAELETEAAALARHGGGATALWSRDELRARGYASAEAFGALHQSVGFGLHPLKYVRGLADAALRRGARIHAFTPVSGWQIEAARHVLLTPRGRVRARRVIIATNGFTRDSLHPALAGTLLPALSNILVTRPLSAAEIAAQGYSTETPVSDTRHLLFYVRLLPDRRFLFGARGGIDASPQAQARQRAWMERRLGDLYPAWKGVETTHFWRGFVCLSAALTPHVAPLEAARGVFCALAYHGSGVAMASWAGRAVGALSVEAPGARAAIPAVIAQPPRRFPLPALRLAWLRLAYAGFRLRDAVP